MKFLHRYRYLAIKERMRDWIRIRSSDFLPTETHALQDRAAVPPGDLQVHQVQRYPEHQLLPAWRLLCICPRRT